MYSWSDGIPFANGFIRKMSFLKTILQKTGRLLLSIVRILRKAFCCRRKRRESGMLLPLTVNYSNPSINETSEFHDWNSWDENVNSSLPSAPVLSEIEYRVSNDGEIPSRQNSTNSNPDEEDFFKDMVPQFRKPKKFIVKELQEEESASNSRRLAMDPKAFPIPERELGLIDDSPSDWREVETLDENWDADSLLKEKKIADREKRIAEHQRRKLEKESKRAYKGTPVKANTFYPSETERAKYS